MEVIKIKVEIIGKKIDRNLELGDIVESNKGFFLVMRVIVKCIPYYVAKNLNGDYGLNGIYESLEDLNKNFERTYNFNDITIYKSNDFKLQLVEVQ